MLTTGLRTLCVNSIFNYSISLDGEKKERSWNLSEARFTLKWIVVACRAIFTRSERRKTKREKGSRRVRECSFPPLSTRRCNPEIRLNVGYPARGTSPFLRSLWTAGSSSHYLARQTPRAHPPRYTPIHTLKGTPRHTAPMCIDVCPRSRIQLKAWTQQPSKTVMHIPLGSQQSSDCRVTKNLNA